MIYAHLSDISVSEWSLTVRDVMAVRQLCFLNGLGQREMLPGIVTLLNVESVSTVSLPLLSYCSEI